MSITLNIDPKDEKVIEQLANRQDQTVDEYLKNVIVERLEEECELQWAEEVIEKHGEELTMLPLENIGRRSDTRQYTIRISEAAQKTLDKMDGSIRPLYMNFLYRLRDINDPFYKGHYLEGNLKGYFSYKVNQQYRILAKLDLSNKFIDIYDFGDHKLYN